MLDIFNAEPFKLQPLSDAINALPFVPGRIDELGIFDSAGTTTTMLTIETKEGILTLIPRTPRGGPGTTVPKGKRKMRKLEIPHQQVDDAIMAEEVQGVREFGSEDTLMTMMGRVLERGQEHSQNFAATEEYARLGAIKGIVHYPDDGEDVNLFDEFGVSQEAEVNFDLSSPTEGQFRKKCAGVIRSVGKNMKGLPWSGKARVFCGDNFFDDVVSNKELRSTFLGWPEAQILREGYIEPNGKSYGAVEFGSLIFENYHGAEGGSAWVDTDKCHIFPVAAKGVLFRTRYAPADYKETVNTVGQRLYAKIIPMRNEKGDEMEVQTNAIHYCRLPKTLMKGKRAA